MSAQTTIPTAHFQIGETVHHRLLDYRGVVVDVDPVYLHNKEPKADGSGITPPRDKPWYRVLVHDTTYMTYVSEQHLETDATGDEIEHPALNIVFDAYEDGRYQRPLTLQ